MTIPEAALKLGISRQRVGVLIREKRLKAGWRKGSRNITKAALNALELKPVGKPRSVYADRQQRDGESVAEYLDRALGWTRNVGATVATSEGTWTRVNKSGGIAWEKTQ